MTNKQEGNSILSNDEQKELLKATITMYENTKAETRKKRKEMTDKNGGKIYSDKSTQETMEDNVHILAEKKSELSEIISETKQDEEKLREQAKALEEKIEPRLLKAFKRIRENARNGLGIVYVQRNACGGCFNRIPAQRQVEVKLHKKVVVCEYCGRILIDPQLAGVNEEA